MLRSGYVSNGQVVFYEAAEKIYQREFKGEKISSLSIPDKIVAIQSEAFADCKSLTSVILPDSIKIISTHCFDGCTGLTQVVLPNGIKVIDEYVFKDCTSLEEIVFPDSVTTIAEGAFAGCRSLSKVVFPKKLKTIGKNAFYKCPLTRIHICGNVKSLSGFHGTDLEEAIIDEGVENIGEACFRGCASLTSLALPESVKTIDHAAFMDCTSLRTLKLPQHLEALGDEAFRGCSSLERIDIPEGVTAIPHLLFVGCTSAHVHLPSTVKEYNTVPEKEKRAPWNSDFYKKGYNDMRSLSVSASNEVLAIESNCLVDKQKRELLHVFDDATEFPGNLRSIKLPEGFCPPLFNVEELIIPEGVTYLSDLPFPQMNRLKRLVLPASLPQVSYAFFNEYPLTSVTASAQLILENNYRYLPGRIDLIGIGEVDEELKGKAEQRFKGNNWIVIYCGEQLLFPAAEVLRAREEKKKHILSLCSPIFFPCGFSYKYLESENEIIVKVFDTLRLHYPVQSELTMDDVLLIRDVATSFRDALDPYIREADDPRVIINKEWKGYEENTEYISCKAFPGVIIHLKLEKGLGAVAYRALENLEKAYNEMTCKYGDKVEKLVCQLKRNKF